jgi:hypothetical protein
MADVEVKPTITAWCKEIKVNRATYYNWMATDGFLEWLEMEWEKAMKKTKPFLDNIGLRNSPKNYKYWEAMQMIYHGFARREERETKNVTEINLSNFQTLKEEELQKLAGQ